MQIKEKFEKAQLIYLQLDEQIEKFDITRLREVNADFFMPITDKRGLGGIIIADDGTYLLCGSRYSVSYYIDEFKKGERTNLEMNKLQ